MSDQPHWRGQDEKNKKLGREEPLPQPLGKPSILRILQGNKWLSEIPGGSLAGSAVVAS